MRMDAFYDRVVAPRLAKLYAAALREVCGVQAPITIIGGRVVAATRATPGAPPRRVSGRLYRSIRVVGNRVYVHAPYAQHLERDGHKFVERAKRLMRTWTKSSSPRITSGS